jgi:hypothetical protein
MEARKIDVKVGQHGKVQFISRSHEINIMSHTLKTAKIDHEIALLPPDSSVLRLTPEIYDRLCPGIKKPVATFKTGQGDPPTKQIIFTSPEKAHEYAYFMQNSMGITVITQIQDVNLKINIVNGVHSKNGQFIIRTDELGQAKLNVAYNYFQHLDSFATLQMIENSLGNLLLDFDQKILSHYINAQSESLNSIRGIMKKEHCSNKTKIMDIVGVYNERTGNKNDSFLGVFTQAVRETVRDSKSSDFLEALEKFKLEEKMDDIIQVSRQYISNQLAQQTMVQPVFNQPVPQVVVQQTVMQPTPVQQSVIYNPPLYQSDMHTNPFLHPEVQTNPFLHQPVQGFANTPHSFYTQQPVSNPNHQIQWQQQEVQRAQQTDIYNNPFIPSGY